MPTECIRSCDFRVEGAVAVLICFDRPSLRANDCIVNGDRREVDVRARCKSERILRTSEPVPTPDESFRRLGSPPHCSRRGTAAYQPTRGATAEDTLARQQSFDVTALLLRQHG